MPQPRHTVDGTRFTISNMSVDRAMTLKMGYNGVGIDDGGIQTLPMG